MLFLPALQLWASPPFVTAATRLLRRTLAKPGLKKKQQLMDEFQSGKPIADIAKDHGRTIRAIESQLEMMGLNTAEQRTPKDRGAP